MRNRVQRAIACALCVVMVLGTFGISANAYTYSGYLPSNLSSLKVTVGGVSMPFSRYPDGSTFSSSKQYMTTTEQADYGLSLGRDLWLRGSQCVAFARYVYAALFYKYPQDATMDNYLAYQSGSSSIYYTDVIKQTFGSSTISAGYTASTLKTLISNCLPGSVMRVSGHSMVIMAIFSDGFVVYDANFSSDDEVDVRSYTWQSFVNSLGSRSIEAVQCPAYHPGYTYSYDNTITNGGSDVYAVDTSKAGVYQVYNTSTGLNVRTAPNIYSTSVGRINSGTYVQVKGTHGEWALIDYNGAERWVNTAYLTAAAANLTVTFNANGGSISETSKTYKVGSTFGSLPTGSRTDYTLLGWYNGDTLYTADSTVPLASSLTLTAKWGAMGFTDVSSGDWFAPYVITGVKDGLIMQDTLFNPYQNATRAQFVTVLAREYGREIGGSYDIGILGSWAFSDLTYYAYYDTAIGWAYANGITNGMGDGKFEPDGSVQRQQIATFLYRYSEFLGLSIGDYSSSSLIYKFSDGANVSDYAVNAMNWAIDIGLFQGDNYGALNPQNPATRAEMVTIMTRFISYLESAQSASISTASVNAEPDLADAVDEEAEPSVSEEVLAPEEEATATEQQEIDTIEADPAA